MLSVLIPAHNAGRFISATLDSLLNDNVDDLEIIVCDDGSTDQTRDIVLSYRNDESRLRYVYQPKSGAAAARNNALSLSRGKSILFFDADDLVRPGSLCAAYNMAQNFPLDIIHFGWAKFWGDPGKWDLGKQSRVRQADVSGLSIPS